MDEYLEQKDTVNPWSHHVIASSNSFNSANAFVPKVVKLKHVENIFKSCPLPSYTIQNSSFAGVLIVYQYLPGDL